MNCQNVALLIHGYIDNELDLQTTLEIESHLQGCEHCRNELGQLTHLRDSVSQGMNYHRTPESLSLALQQISKNAGKKPRFVINLRPAWHLLQPWVAMVVIVSAISLGFNLQLASPRDHLAEDAVSAHIRSLMAEHLTDVASSDQHTVKPWFNGKLDFSPRVVDLTEQGFPLVGGRLDYLEARAVSALVYRRRQHLINVFIWPDNQNELHSEYDASRNGFNLLAYHWQGMNYWIVSDLNKNELMELKKHLLQQ